MSRGPLRRLVGMAGLASLTPTSLMLMTDALTPTDAIVRAVVAVAAVILLGRLADTALSGLIATYLEQTATDGEQESER